MLTRLQTERATTGTCQASYAGKLPFLIFLLAAVNSCLGSPGLVVGTASTSQRSVGQVGWTVADFDGDSQPDVATTRMEARGAGYVYWLELDLSTNRKDDSSLAQANLPSAVSSIFGLHLTPRDVDGDHDLDIVVTMGITRQPVAVWINDGKGRFEEGDLSAYPALTSLVDLSFSAPAAPDTTQIAYDQGPRSRFALTVSRRTLQALVRCSLQALARPESSVPLFPLEQAPARAPPSYF
jgi:hypothetical protein